MHFCRPAKSFDTVDHDILLTKLEHYGLRSTSTLWFKSYLDNRTQLVSLNDINSETKIMKHDVPYGSVVDPLSFLFYMNDLYCAILHSHPYQYAEDTHLQNISNFPKKVQKQLNIDLKLLCNWLLKILLNSKKRKLLFPRILIVR